MLTVTSWVDVITRVRGLRSRLLGRATLERVAASRNLAAMIKELDATAYHGVIDLEHEDPVALERQTRRAAGDRMNTIAAWCNDRVAELSLLFEDEDRRNLRALSRAVAANVAVERRTAGLLPTPALPNGALEALAKQSRLRDLGALLASWGNPYGAAILSVAVHAHPDLFLLQLAIDHVYASRTIEAADRAGDPLRGYVRTQIDEENARTALAAASRSLEQPADGFFIAGGELITREEFERLRHLTPAESRQSLARLLAGTVLAPIVPEGAADADEATLTAQLRALHRAVLLDPLSLSAVIEYVLRLRAELRDLARIIWGITLAVPRRRIVAGLVTP